MATLDFLVTSFGLQRTRILQDTPLLADSPAMYSKLGTPVYSALEIKPSSYRDQDGATVNYPGILIPGVIMSIAQQKNIVKTPVAGRNGTFKEYISDGDFSVSIQGIFASEQSNVYPESEVSVLRQILKASASLDVVSRYLNGWGIYQLAVEYYEIPQRAGYYNTQIFSIQAVSDTPFELEKK